MMNISLLGARLKLTVASFALMVFCALLFSNSAHAKLSDELEGMFANVTSAGNFQTTLRSGWAGGGIGIRGPIKNINIIAFDPPRLSAGCGGIDFFGGSFSFINSEQLIALFRSIAMNAVGVAFKAAIDAINPALGAIMQDFQAIVQAMNIGNANTCAIASSIVNSAASYMGIESTTKSAVVGEKTALGRFADTLASYTDGWFTDSQKSTKEAAADQKFAEVGNWTWKALGRSHVADTLPDPITGENNAKANKEFVMSVIGTRIVGTQPNTSSSTSDGRSATLADSNHPPTIVLSILKKGPQKDSSQVIEKMRCEEVTGGVSTVPDGACDKISYVTVGSDFKGIYGYVSKMFFGHDKGMAQAPEANSIISKLFYCSDSTTAACSLTAEQKNFMASVRGPAVTLLLKTLHDSNLAAKVADDLIPIISNDYYMMYLDTFERAARTAYSGGGQQPVPVFVQDVVKQLHEMKQDALKEAENHIPKYNQLAEYVERALKTYEKPRPIARQN